MPLQVVEADDADLLRAAELERLAYSPSRFNMILFPGPHPPNALELRAQDLVEMRHEDPTTRWHKVVDTELSGDDAMIAFAKWHVYNPKPAPRKMRPLRAGCNVEACQAVFGGIMKLQEEIMQGRSFVYLNLLQTNPKHQKRGAGSMLIDVVIDEATRLGLPAYLESSEVAHPLYLKQGFVDLVPSNVDMAPWGLNEVHRTWCMIREMPSS